MRNPDLARTYEEIGDSGKNVFYTGRIAREIVNCLASQGGILSLEDLSGHESRFTEAISVSYASKKLGKSFRIWENPLNSQAVVALESLKILEALGAEKFTKSDRTDYFHAVVEAVKLSFEDLSNIWKEAKSGVPRNSEKLLTEKNAVEKAKLINMKTANRLWDVKGKHKMPNAHIRLAFPEVYPV